MSSMTIKPFHLSEESEVFKELENKLLNKIKIMYVFNDNKHKSNLILVTNDDNTYAFGGNASGVLGFGHQNEVKELTLCKNLCHKKIVDFKSGFQHMISRSSDGMVYVWGSNEMGVLGQRKRSQKIYKPKQLVLNKHFYHKKIVDISTGFCHSLALTCDGQLYCWGDNTSGQIGSGSGDKDIGLKPKLLNCFGEKVTSISCGAYHSLVLTESGLVFSWGNNECGQLGNGMVGNDNYPKPISQIGGKIIKISAGFDHNLILTNEGFIYTFGCNECGELGSYPGALNNQFLPKKLKSSEKFIDIESNNSCRFSAALTQFGHYYGWGLCGKYSDKIIFEPKLMKMYKSFEELFVEELGITQRPINKRNEYFQRRVSIDSV